MNGATASSLKRGVELTAHDDALKRLAAIYGSAGLEVS
jgi:hypothetical protein